MIVTIASFVRTAIVEHAAAAAPDEACGILLGRASAIDDVVVARNVAAAPGRSFEIDPALLLTVHREARRDGRDVVGFYHSHPNGAPTPSARDAAGAVEDGKVWVIVADGMVSGWQAVGGAPVHGRFAPVDLVPA